MTPTKSFMSSILSTIAVALGAVLLLGIALQPAMAKVPGPPTPTPSCSFTNNGDDSLTLTATGLSARYPKAEAKTDVTITLDGNTITSARIQSDSYVATFTATGDYFATFNKTTSGAALKASCAGTIFDDDTDPPVFYNFVVDVGPIDPDTEDAVVDFSVQAVDNYDSDPTVSCDTASGTRFPVGQTWVTCYATDDSGNTRTDYFKIIVATPANCNLDMNEYPEDNTSELELRAGVFTYGEDAEATKLVFSSDTNPSIYEDEFTSEWGVEGWFFGAAVFGPRVPVGTYTATFTLVSTGELVARCSVQVFN